MKKVLLFTHGIDIDGYGCAVLANLAFGDAVEIHYADNFELDEMFSQRVYGVSAKELLEKDALAQKLLLENAESNLKEFEKIYITDHCLSFPLCQIVNEDKSTASKLLVLDHHASRKSEQGQFPWVKIVEDFPDGTKACGTNLFYFYLLRENAFPPAYALARWARYTSLCDTWTWKGSACEEDCLRLDTLGKALGRDAYVKHFTQKLRTEMPKNKPFEYSLKEKNLIEKYRAAYKKQLETYVQDIKIVDFDGLKAGFVHIKDLFKNDIAERVRHLPLGQKINFLLMPVDDRESVSLRNIDPACDVSKIAQKYGGGGHFAAASFPKSNLPKKDFEKN